MDHSFLTAITLKQILILELLIAKTYVQIGVGFDSIAAVNPETNGVRI
jgi:hypothetical protein